jgi:hypothetical protein
MNNGMLTVLTLNALDAQRHAHQRVGRPRRSLRGRRTGR